MKKKILIESIFLAFACVVCVSLSLFRCSFTNSKVFFFLNWNLFLAMIPWLLVTFLKLINKQKSMLMLFLTLCVWVLFFPNAPYILTDLFHLRYRTTMPIWYDLIMILAFAWTGLLFGFLSLRDIESFFTERVGGMITKIGVFLMLFLCGFGIYLGRFLRWNSWDVINEPMKLLFDISDRFTNPFLHPRTWGVTLMMGLFLNIVYFSFDLISKREAID